MSRFGKVAVLMGGRSAEREVSLRSGTAVLQALTRSGIEAFPFDPAEKEIPLLKEFDRVFIALHGRYGEDGSIQGALELLNIPYTGSGVMASSIAMDKFRTKLVWMGAGIPTPPFELLEPQTDLGRTLENLGLPLMVKPASEGSSIGMSKVNEGKDLKRAYELAAQHDKIVIAEKFIKGTELTVAILGDEVLPMIRLETPRDFYDFEAKYLASDTHYHCPAGLAPEKEKELGLLAQKAFRVLGCRGWGRIDLMLDQAGAPYFLEANTSPGMTDHSLVPMAAKAAGMSFEQLVVKILEGAHVG